MADRVRVGPGSDLPTDTGTIVASGQREIAVFRVGGEIFAIDNECPHREGPLGHGDLDGEIVTCPFHAWQINVRTGEVVDFPEMCARTVPVVFEEGIVYVVA